MRLPSAERCTRKVPVPEECGRPAWEARRGLTKARLVVFCDGDYWHGRGWPERRARLEKGHNATYWIAKIARNMERDRERTETLQADGWTVIRVWETDILANPELASRPIVEFLRERGHFSRS